MNFSLFLSLWWIFPIFTSAITNSSDYSMISAIRNKIFNGYDPMAHPVINHTHPISVRMKMRLLHFGLDSRQSLLNFHSYFRIEWSDPYLKWNKSEFRGIKRINVHMDDVFTPDLILYNSIQPTNMMKKFNHTELIITYDGTIFWSPLLRMQSFCKLDLYNWPYDQQSCSLIFISWSYPADALALYISTKSINLRDLWPNNEWKIINSTCDTIIVSDIPGRPNMFFPGVQYKIFMQRRQTPYSYLINIPIICTVILNVISLSLVNPKRKIRFHLNQLSFFIILFISFYPSYILGPAMFGTTQLVKFLGSMLITNASLMFWSTIASNVIESKSNRIAEKIWNYITEPALHWRLIQSFNHYDIYDNDANDDDNDRQSIINQQQQQQQRKQNFLFVLLVDRILLIIFLIIFFIFHRF
ncbi:neuronal acetylcholine receptor subunit non-alpha-2-like isoform X1 [Dermatophagoides farinae]|uniref:neuronal acetylcholine receptor subunit non-alpha-2-like isoform X1 n=2 Tax=Dermatophagoides farinae TaxID=6954 RepID=UPI003F62E378